MSHKQMLFIKQCWYCSKYRFN